VLKTQLMKSFD